jgi:hypothetical protein
LIGVRAPDYLHQPVSTGSTTSGAAAVMLPTN